MSVSSDSIAGFRWLMHAGATSLCLLVLCTQYGVPGTKRAKAADWASPPHFQAGQFDDPDVAVEAGRQALRRSQDYPWYDSSADAIERVDVEVPRKPMSSNWNWNFGSLADFFRILGWLVLAMLLATIVYFLVRTFLSRETQSAVDSTYDPQLADRSDIDRVEALPFRLQRPQSNLLGEAERHYREGNYAEAIIYLYSYQLVELDRHQAIRLSRGKTNRQFLREAKARTSVAELLERTMVIFEDAFFGGHPITRDRFETVYNRTDEFQTTLALANA